MCTGGGRVVSGGTSRFAQAGGWAAWARLAPNRLWTPGETRAASKGFRWQIKGLRNLPTYGMVAGELKTLKTYLAQAILLGVAGGVPVLGEFEVAEPQTVLVYIGEGGRDPYMDRLDRMASAYGLDDAWESRCHFRFGSCPFTSPDFQRA